MIEFDITKLNEKDLSFYEGLTDSKKKIYEKKWISLERQKEKTNQAKAQLQKMKKAQSEKLRKERTRHLIEIGGIVEKYAPVNNLEAFEEYIKKYAYAIQKTQSSSQVQNS